MALKLSYIISPFQKVQDYLRRFESIPDMLELDHLTVSGDVTFGKNVSLKVSVQWGCCCNKSDWSQLILRQGLCTESTEALLGIGELAQRWQRLRLDSDPCDGVQDLAARAVAQAERFIYEPWKHHRPHISVETLLPPLSFGSVIPPFPGWPCPTPFQALLHHFGVLDLLVNGGAEHVSFSLKFFLRVLPVLAAPAVL